MAVKSYTRPMPAPALKTTIQQNLDTFCEQRIATDTSLTRAAVAVVVSRHSENGNPCIYLTLRSDRLRKHAGQFALPGGKLDHGESLQQAALRELNEELGIALESPSVLGLLDDFQTRSGFAITPVVVWNDSDQTLKPNPDEVARCYEIPLTELLADDLISNDAASHQQIFSISPASVGTCVYSPTAAIIYQFAEVALRGRHTRVDHFEQPAFAWR
jgi:8-oxo-dGTP pyrophosphatase MutT (NUDIX family)